MTDDNDIGTTTPPTAPVGMAQRTTQAGSDIATGLIATIGNVLETATHAVGNIGVTAVQEASRVLTTTVLGVRQTIGSAMTGTRPDFKQEQQQEHDYRQTR